MIGGCADVIWVVCITKVVVVWDERCDGDDELPPPYVAFWSMTSHPFRNVDHVHHNEDVAMVIQEGPGYETALFIACATGWGP